MSDSLAFIDSSTSDGGDGVWGIEVDFATNDVQIFIDGAPQNSDNLQGPGPKFPYLLIDNPSGLPVDENVQVTANFGGSPFSFLPAGFTAWNVDDPTVSLYTWNVLDPAIEIFNIEKPSKSGSNWYYMHLSTGQIFSSSNGHQYASLASDFSPLPTGPDGFRGNYNANNVGHILSFLEADFGGPGVIQEGIGFSLDGITWVVGLTFPTNRGFFLFSNSNSFIAVAADTGEVYHSTNGTTWSVVFTLTLSLVLGHVANDRYYLDDGGGLMHTSADGATWVDTVPADFTGADIIGGIPSLFALIGSGGAGTFTSTNGVTFTSLGVTRPGLINLGDDDVQLVATVGGEAQVLMVSPDAVGWTPDVSFPNPPFHPDLSSRL